MAPASGAQVDKPKRGCVDRVADAVLGGVENVFRKLGWFIGNRPWILMGASIVLFLALCGGFARFTLENRGEKLWVPGGTEAQKDKSVVDDKYTVKFARFEEVVLTTDPPGGNVLTPAVFDKLFELHNEIINITAENPIVEGGPLLVYDNKGNEDEVNMCFRRGPDCLQINVLGTKGFNFDPNKWKTENRIVDNLNSEDGLTLQNGEKVELLSFLGGVEKDENGQIVSAEAISVQYFINNNETVSASEGPVDEEADAWEEQFLDFLEGESEKVEMEGEYRLYRFAVRAFADEFGKTIEGDVRKLNVAIILLLLYASTMLNRWSEGCVGTRGVLTVGGFLSIGMAIAGSLGLGSALGLFYSQLMSILPFLIIGIGIDDVFVMVNAYDQTPTSMTVPERLSIALGSSGSSITVTSLTDFCAFLIGSNTSLPALRNFSIFAALGILLTWIFQITFFAGWLTLDEKYRRSKNRADWLCCITCSGKPGPLCKCAKDTFLKNALGGFAKFLARTPVKIAVMLAFAGIAAGGIAGVVNLEVDADVDDFIPPDSYLSDWNDVRETYYTTVGPSTGVYVDNKDGNIDFTKKEVQDQLTSLYEAFRNDPHVIASTTDSWFESFKKSENGTIEAAGFDGRFAAWLFTDPDAGGGLNFIGDVVLGEDGKIETARFTGNHKQSQKSNDLVKFMNSLRSTVADNSGILSENTFGYGPDYVQFEQYKAIGREALVNIGLALLMVAIIIVLLLVNPIASIVTFLAIALVVLELVGYMHWWGFTLDNVVVIFLVISLGLAVDYSVHIAHSFLTSAGTPNERMFKALTEMGPAVVHGAMSTFIAVLTLGLSNSYVFITFFRALFLCVSLGVAHGIILLPVAMSILAPKTQGSHDKPEITNSQKHSNSPQDASKMNIEMAYPLEAPPAQTGPQRQEGN